MPGLVLWPAVAVLALALLASTPYWLPAKVIALRMRLFAAVNGEEGIPVPGELVGIDDYRRVYADPAANGRSRGAGLSDLFWYWLAPGPHVHQEHLEAGPRYDQVAHLTRQILIRSKQETEDRTRRCVTHVLDELGAGRRVVRLRDLMMPVWAELYYELVFEQPCPPEARRLIVDNADDVVSALKCCRPRHMRRRARLTAYLLRRITAGDVPHPLPGLLTAEEQTYSLQGTFFNTAVVQMSEAMTHLLLAIAQHPDVQLRLAADPGDTAYLDRVIDEALRTWPLFGIAHRILTADVHTGQADLAAGSVVCFSYPEYHRTGYPDPERFDPDRWETLAARDAHFIPFGITANRPCPARGLAPVTMRVVTREVLRRYALHSSAAHTRSAPNRGPCLLVPRSSTSDRTRAALALMRVRDRAEDVTRSIAQLVFGTYMVLDARRKALCVNYFAQHPEAAPAGPAPAGPAPSGAASSGPVPGCPVRGH